MNMYSDGSEEERLEQVGEELLEIQAISEGVEELKVSARRAHQIGFS